MRVSPPRVFGTAARAPRPAAGSPGADAHRQAGFVLGAECDLVVEGLELEGALAELLAGPRFRRQPVAAVLALWSRGWLTRLSALHAAETGNYVAALALVRSSADAIAASIAMLRTGAAEWIQWLDEGGVALAPAAHALEYRLHPFRSAETLAGHEVLGRVYRGATELSLPHFGSTLLVAGDASDPGRIAVTFGDRDFHLGLGEIVLGWLLELSVAQLEAVVSENEAFDAGESRGDVGRYSVAALGVVARKDRCRLEAADVEGLPRTVVQNFRRGPGAAAGRLLL